MKKFQNKKTVMGVLAIGAALSCIVWFLLLWNDLRIVRADSDITQKLDNDSNYVFSLDTVEYQKDKISTTRDYIQLKGWLACKGKPVNKATIRIVLKKENTDEYYILPTTVTERQDVTESMADGQKYDWSGFEVKIPYDGKINLEVADYEIYALYNLNAEGEKLVSFHTSVKGWGK